MKKGWQKTKDAAPKAAALNRTPREKLPPGMKSKIHQENTVANLAVMMTVTAWGWIIDDGMGFAGRVALNCPCSRRSSNAAASAIANQPESGWNSRTRRVHRFHKWVGVSQNQIQHFPFIFGPLFPLPMRGLLHLLIKNTSCWTSSSNSADQGARLIRLLMMTSRKQKMDMVVDFWSTCSCLKRKNTTTTMNIIQNLS